MRLAEQFYEPVHETLVPIAQASNEGACAQTHQSHRCSQVGSSEGSD